MNIDRIISIIAIILALGGATFSVLKTNNSLEFLTKQDFNTFQIENVRKITSLENAVQNGFYNVSQQIAALQFLPSKDFMEHKESDQKRFYDFQRQQDELKKDSEVYKKIIDNNTKRLDDVIIARAIENNSARISILEGKLGKLESVNK